MNNLLRTILAILPMALPVPTRAADPWSGVSGDHLTFRAGQPYQLRPENHGKDLHARG